MCRLGSKAIQNCLLNKKDLLLTKAVDLANSKEAAAKEVTELHSMTVGVAPNASATK